MSIHLFSESLSARSYFSNVSYNNCDTSILTYKTLTESNIAMDTLNSYLFTLLDKPWIGSVIGSLLVGLSGIFPLLFIHVEGDNLKKGVGGQSLKLLLSFAVGGLLGDVFLHLLPEAWTLQAQHNQGDTSMFCGCWVLVGLLLFVTVEKLFAAPPLCDNDDGSSLLLADNNNLADKPTQKQVAGYLNLMANGIDNFTHGLAVGGSFLLSPRVGVLTTFAILVHEVPHEIGDFAILLRAGFSRWEAAKAQLVTGSAGLVGALTAVSCSGAGSAMEAKTSWILPFTAGGFLHISLVTVLPELLQEEDPRESLKQLLSLVCGIVLMAVLTAICEG